MAYPACLHWWCMASAVQTCGRLVVVSNGQCQLEADDVLMLAWVAHHAAAARRPAHIRHTQRCAPGRADLALQGIQCAAQQHCHHEGEAGIQRRHGPALWRQEDARGGPAVQQHQQRHHQRAGLEQRGERAGPERRQGALCARACMHANTRARARCRARQASMGCRKRMQPAACARVRTQWTVGRIIMWAREHLLTERPELFMKGDSV